MSRIQIKSIFQDISEMVFVPTGTLAEIKARVATAVESRAINDKDKKSIIRNINEAKSIVRLQTYICNSLLQYEGLGMNQLGKSDHIETEHVDI